MSSQGLIGVVILAVGVVLLVMGLRAMDSIGSQFSKFFTGSPSDRAVWMTLGGIAAILIGGAAAALPARGSGR